MIELLPSRGSPRYNQPEADDGNGLTFWVLAGTLFMIIAISGNSMEKLKKDSSDAAHSARIAIHEDAVPRSSRRIGTD